ncbi:tRNA (cytidine(34)-2'-O)-methyltransferase [Maribacter dokdonensis]|uniref:tRNA (cytidine(34)-2'-O)-methyltransferase n=1 Tax=Maribacter dokdonensis TaxID=320912 RepID=UPI00273516A6|nr:tRNA (cytidine(34)-2'-O)-methyltransferase [Maribacter dokdonensis]MDP2527636.1 tRNA (cytidine(34)-2'-O)-methyltransferase [Maribacter dokdonensis]
MGFHIVLIEPEIPNNTGNIGRLALGTGSTLHLVKPFGFELSDKRLKRAGLDYWQHLNVVMYENVDAFFKEHDDKKMIFFSATATKNHWEIDFEDDMFLVFGKESVGLPKALLNKHQENAVKIPLYSTHIRSLNLANAVAISIYEGLRQIN